MKFVLLKSSNDKSVISVLFIEEHIEAINVDRINFLQFFHGDPYEAYRADKISGMSAFDLIRGSDIHAWGDIEEVMLSSLKRRNPTARHTWNSSNIYSDDNICVDPVKYSSEDTNFFKCGPNLHPHHGKLWTQNPE